MAGVASGGGSAGVPFSDKSDESDESDKSDAEQDRRPPHHRHTTPHRTTAPRGTFYHLSIGPSDPSDLSDSSDLSDKVPPPSKG